MFSYILYGTAPERLHRKPQECVTIQATGCVKIERNRVKSRSSKNARPSIKLRSNRPAKLLKLRSLEAVEERKAIEELKTIEEREAIEEIEAIENARPSIKLRSSRPAKSSN